MDVSRPSPLGTMPISRAVGVAAAPAATPTDASATHACGGAGSCASCAAGGGGSSGDVLIRGARDGQDIRLASGIVLRCMTLGGARVTRRELQEAIEGILALPPADQLLVARAGVPIELVPVAALENGILGATTIAQGAAGTWTPSLVRIALRSPYSSTGSVRERIGEIVQHELGHVQAVLRGQDRSEPAAELYAKLH